MKLPSLLLVLFSVVVISSAHAAPEAATGGERSTFTGSEVVFDIESNQSPRPGSGQTTRAVPANQGNRHDDTVDGRFIGGTVRAVIDRAPEPDFFSLVR